MIKRITFATRRDDVAPWSFPDAWRDAVAGLAQAPSDARPVRAAVSLALPGFTGSEARHDGIGVEWFSDAAHLERFHSWLRTPKGTKNHAAIDEVVEAETVLADELVLRGADWLEGRWRRGGQCLKHMAIAVRAAHLSPAEFSQEWRSHAGTVQQPGHTLTIPDRVRGLAYVQNHLRQSARGSAYDALNEVYLDDVEALRARAEWFQADEHSRPDPTVFATSWFIAAREQVLFSAS